MYVIRSHKHEVYTDEVNKVALCPNNDKRHVLEDSVHTLALGHYKIYQNIFLFTGENILILYGSFNRVFSFTNWTYDQCFYFVAFITHMTTITK